jgi:hypothetical protein
MAGRSRNRCSAWARSAGRPCQARVLAGGRCAQHGGAAVAVNVGRNALWRSQLGLPSSWRYRRYRVSATRWLELEAERQKAKQAEKPLD